MIIYSKLCLAIFTNYYKLVIAIIILILDNVNNSVQIGYKNNDTVHFTKTTNTNFVSKVLRRYTRQTINDNENCEIPTNPNFTTYTIREESPTSYISGNFVRKLSTLEISCIDGYHLNPFETNVAVCLNGRWEYPPTACIRTCTSLISTRGTKVQCSYNNITLENCINPVEGTLAFLSCDPLYEVHSQQLNPVSVCRAGRWHPSILQCYPICGIKHLPVIEDIIYGNRYPVKDFPWQVGVYSSTTKENICGGSIIAENVILSAAHCFTDYNGKVKPVSNYLVAAGKAFRNYSDERDQLAQYSNIQAIHVPERYKGIVNLYAFDLAILILSDPFILSESVQPVCIELSEISNPLILPVNTIGLVTAWGYTTDGEVVWDVLKELQILYFSYEKCYHEVPKNFRRFVTDDKICGLSLCRANSGSGLVVQNTMNNNRYVVKGIASISPATEKLICDSNQYSTFTSINYHVHFVRDIVVQYRLKMPVECTSNMCEDNLNDKNKKPQITSSETRGHGINCSMVSNHTHLADNWCDHFAK